MINISPCTTYKLFQSLCFQPFTLHLSFWFLFHLLFLFPDAIIISFHFIHNMQSNYIFLISDDIVAIFHPKLLHQNCLQRREKKRNTNNLSKVICERINIIITHKEISKLTLNLSKAILVTLMSNSPQKQLTPS